MVGKFDGAESQCFACVNRFVQLRKVSIYILICKCLNLISIVNKIMEKYSFESIFQFSWLNESYIKYLIYSSVWVMYLSDLCWSCFPHSCSFQRFIGRNFSTFSTNDNSSLYFSQFPIELPINTFILNTIAMFNIFVIHSIYWL